ncbi:MAG: FtsX-like permease family protein [Clostridiaceae bacterium]|nr:FtsX-like permease family protein [Clostridiaceae bacterium]
MSFFESLKQALDSLYANKLRSILTMLGIIMGVFSVITILAIGNAAESYIGSEFEKMGANTITITYQKSDMSQEDMLTLEDMETIKKVAPEIKNIAANIQRGGSLRIGNKTRDAIMYGVSSQYKSFSAIELAEGRFINEFDNTSKSNVIVVDEYFANRYFKRLDIVGETVTLKTTWGKLVNMNVVGVIKSYGELYASMLDNENVPAIVYVPITTLQSIYFNDKVLQSIDVSTEEEDGLKELGDRIVKALEMKRGKSDLFYAQSSQDIQKVVSNVLGVISSILLVIAIITLIVGGIGIVNILLVSVTERIREIGIRKALGAQKMDILLQFITESIIMTGISGLIGIILGVLAGNIISQLISIPPVVDIPVIIGAFLGSVALGLIFGVYPAKKAADLDPIESLRYE